MMAVSQEDEHALVRAAAAGNHEAFAALVDRHASAVLSVTTRMVGNAADAQDLAQETFVSAHKALGRFQFGSKLSTWLYRIAVNKCKDWLRARRAWTVSVHEEDEDGALKWDVPDEQTPLGALVQSEVARELEQGIAGLPALYREAFVLKHIEGLDYQEMSDILGVAGDTLKMRVYKARTLLCRTLAHLEDSGR